MTNDLTTQPPLPQGEGENVAQVPLRVGEGFRVRSIILGNKISPSKLELVKAFRKAPTPKEDEVWQWLRNKKMFGLKWRRQQIIEGFIADFYCHKLKLVLEVDGSVHFTDFQKEYDLERSNVFSFLGLKTIRINNSDCTLENLTSIIARELEQYHDLTPQPPLPKGEGENVDKVPLRVGEGFRVRSKMYQKLVESK